MKHDANILEHLEEQAAQQGSDPFFIDAMRGYVAVTWYEARRYALQLVRAWRALGYERGDTIALDMANSAELIFALLAGAYGGYRLVLLNVRLTEAEKAERLRELSTLLQTESLCALTENDIQACISRAFVANPEQLKACASEELNAFSEHVPAIVMFTSGTSGKPKAAALTWANLTGASRASNEALNVTYSSRWQAVLPMCHVGGLQVFVRAVLARSSLILYRKVHAAELLRDATEYGCTHVSVVDKLLQDMLQADTTQAPLSYYQCILLGGSAPNKSTLQASVGAGAHVVTSYGMTETCSHVAWTWAEAAEEGMHLLSGYRAQILDPDKSGFGKLAIAGPGVFEGYLNAQACYSEKGAFITGDRACLKCGRLIVAERTSDMFVSGGENVYPEEIRKTLLEIPYVTDAYVFGAEDATWGRRPIAFVEVAQANENFDGVAIASDISIRLQSCLARMYQPREMYALREFPRQGIGKVDRVALERLYAEHIDVSEVHLWHICLPFVHPIRTANTVLHERELLIVQVSDDQGHTGIGEDVSFASDWYLPETLERDMPIIAERLIPTLLQNTFLKPSDISVAFKGIPGSQSHPMACAALESAVWDLYGKIVGVSIRDLIGGRELFTNAKTGHSCHLPQGCAPGGAVLGIDTPERSLQAVCRFVEAGYSRVKLKVKPGHDVDIVKAVRTRFPALTIVLDANQSYNEDQTSILQTLTSFDIAYIEEPLKPDSPSTGEPLPARLARLQHKLACPIALDESWTTSEGLYDALRQYPELRCVVVKIAKFGGVQPALDFCAYAQRNNIEVCLGGMFDTGIGKRLTAAFSMLPNVVVPGDISDTAEYFPVDISEPPFTFTDGCIQINPPGHEAGLGCTLNKKALLAVTARHTVYRSHSAAGTS